MPPSSIARMLLLVVLIVAIPHALAVLSQPVFREIKPEGQSMPPRYCHSSTTIKRWSLGIFYGGRSQNEFFTDLWTYSIVSSQWTVHPEPTVFTGTIPPGLCWSCLSAWDEAASSSLLMGGMDPSGRPVSSTWLLTYAQPKPYWQQMVLSGLSPAARFGHSCARVPGSRIATIIYGGFDRADSVLNDVWMLDSNFVWKQLPSFHPSRPLALAHAAIYLGHDIIIIHGGVDATMSVSSSTIAAHIGMSDGSLFTQPAPLNWSTYACSGTPPQVSSLGFAYATNAMSLMIFGGESLLHPADVSSSTLFVYKLDTGTRRWSVIRPLGYPSQRSHHVLLFDECSETLLAFGGRSPNGLVLHTDSLSLPSNVWRQLSIPVLIPNPRAYHVLVAFTEAIIIHGGIDLNFMPRDSVFRDTWRFSLSDQSWTHMIPAAGLASAPYRAYHAAVRAGQFAIITGGVDNNFIAQSSTMLLSSVTGEWQTVTQPSSLPAIFNHSMDVMLSNGQHSEIRGGYLGSLSLIAFGGSQGGSLSNRAWLTNLNLHPQNGRGSSNLMLAFDGIFDYLIVSDFVNLGGEFTIAFWMNAGGFESESQAIMSIGSIGRGLQIVQCLNAGSICFYCEGSKMLVGRIKVNDGLWHHIAVTFSVISRSMTIYVDGSRDATRSDQLRAPIFDSLNFNIGRGGLNHMSYFPGAIDDLCVWRSALTAGQVSSLVSGQIEASNLAAVWNFDNTGTRLMQPNMFPSVQQNYIMYCGGGHGNCPSLVTSSAPKQGLTHKYFQFDGWNVLVVAEGSPEPPARHSHAAAAVNGHMLLVHGGIGTNNNVLDDLWVGAITLGKSISWSQLFQPQTFGLYAHSLVSHYDIPNQDYSQIVSIISKDPDSTCNIDLGVCRSFSFSANFMDSCPSLCSVPVMHGTRADKTFKNDIYGFGGNAVSSVAQNNLWSFLSDGSWHSIVPSSPQSHLRTSWPQIVPKIHPETKTWDGDTLISVSSNDDAYPELDGAGSLNIMLFSTSRSVWLQPSASAVLNRPSARRGHLLTSYHGSLHPGQIVVFGGNEGNTFFNQTYVLNPHATVANLKFYNWTLIDHVSVVAPPALSQPGGFVHNDTLWIYGGLSATNLVQSTLWSFNFGSKQWTRHSSISPTAPKPCYGCSLVFVDTPASIKAYLVFGRSVAPAALFSSAFSSDEQGDHLSPSVFLLTIVPLSNNSFRIEWNAAPSIALPGPSPNLRHHASAAMYGQTLVVFGGFDKMLSPLNDFWILKDGMMWVQLKQPQGPPARGFACIVPMVELNGIYIFAGSSDFNGFSPLKDLWFVSVSSSSPSSFQVMTSTLSVAYAGQRTTFSLLASDFFNGKKDNLFCYEDVILHLTTDQQSINGIVSFDSDTAQSVGGCVYKGSYVVSQANLYQMTLNIYGHVIDGFPITVNVQAAAPDPDFSGLIFPSDVGACDGLSTDRSTSFIVRTFDRNGNAGMNPSQISIESYLLPDPFWHPLVDQNDESNWEFSTSLQTNILDYFNGDFQVAISNTRSGNYSISVLLEGKPVSGSPFACSIDTANVEPSLLRIKSVTILTVGAYSSFYLQTVDQFGNNISTAPGVAGDVVAAQLVSDDLVIDAAVLEGDRGIWTMNVHPKVTGRSRLVVIVNDLTVLDQPVQVVELMKPLLFSQVLFTAIWIIPCGVIVVAFTMTSFLHYRACMAQQAKFLAQIGDVTTPPEPAAETFDDVDKVHLDPDWIKADEACKQLRKIGQDHDAQDGPGRRLVYIQMIEVLTGVGDKLGLSIDEGALLEESMLDDAAVQAVFATFISGDSEGKDGLEELQTRLRRISTCVQFTANTPRDLEDFNVDDDLGMAASDNYGPEGPPPDSARAATTEQKESNLLERVRRGSAFDIDV